MSISSGITWLLVVAGWGLTHVFSEARERRKEMRAQLDKLYELLFAIEKDARSFHRSECFDIVKASELILKLNTFERILTRILFVDNFIQNLIQLRRSITLDNFDLSIFSQQALDCDILHNIISACEDFEDAIEQYYLRKYPHTFPYIRFWLDQK